MQSHVEMEGLGFLEACRPYPLIKSLLIRGISDLIDAKGESDQAGSQPYAATVATEFLFGLLTDLDISAQLINESIEKKLNEICPKLYPEGIRDKSVWIRAGGDLSVIHLYTSGKAQWAEALRMIENGGGGEELDFATLIRTMLKDYPSNQSLKEL